MAIPATIPYIPTTGVAHTLVPMASRPDGITRRVNPTSPVGYPIVLAVQTSILPVTANRKFKVNRFSLTSTIARNDTVFGDFVDQITLVGNLPQITVPTLSEAVRAQNLLLIIEQYLKGAAFVAGDVTGGKYDTPAVSDLLTGQS